MTEPHKSFIVIFETMAGTRSEAFEFDYQAEHFAGRVNGKIVPMIEQADGTWVAVG